MPDRSTLVWAARRRRYRHRLVPVPCGEAEAALHPASLPEAGGGATLRRALQASADGVRIAGRVEAAGLAVRSVALLADDQHRHPPPPRGDIARMQSITPDDLVAWHRRR